MMSSFANFSQFGLTLCPKHRKCIGATTLEAFVTKYISAGAKDMFASVWEVTIYHEHRVLIMFTMMESTVASVGRFQQQLHQ